MNSLFSAVALSAGLLFTAACAQKSTTSEGAKSVERSLEKKGAAKLLLRSEEFKTLSPVEIADYELAEPTLGPFTHAFFGYIDPQDPDSHFQVSDEVPHKIGVYYGWALKVHSGASSSLSIEETLTLPQPARIFRVNTDRSHVAADGTQVRSQLKLNAEDGWIFNFWQLTPGDPEGEYQLEIKFESKPVVSFSFDVLR